MTVENIVTHVIDKSNFQNVQNYIDFCLHYLDFLQTGIQATIVSQNENQYRFFQYREDGNYNVTRPINSNIFYSSENQRISSDFLRILHSIREQKKCNLDSRTVIVNSIYTIQETIGAALDALPSGESNRARKINGDLFERFIQLLIREIGIKCLSGTIQVPVKIEDEVQFYMSYQHDLMIYNGEEIKVIGSVKTSSKDRIDKIFIDKFLYSKLTDTALPHIAIFLNDVQRKQTKRESEYGINSTFLSGHFKGYTVKLNPLDGVYYCDIRPNMVQDRLLNQHIKTIDHLFCTDLWSFIQVEGIPLDEVSITEGEGESE